jgi:hypothetical protein
MGFLGELAEIKYYPSPTDGAGRGYINRTGKVVWEPKKPNADKPKMSEDTPNQRIQRTRNKARR